MEESLLKMFLTRTFADVGELPIVPTAIGVFAVVVIVLAVSELYARKKSTSEQEANQESRPAPEQRSENPSEKLPESPPEELEENLPKILIGKAYVNDGDGIEVRKWQIRLAGIDAPEHGQRATSQDGEAVDQGWMARDALFQKVVGKGEVRVVVHEREKHGRLLGTVYLGERDVCREMVREGYAVAYMEHGEKYKKDQKEAQRERLGIWGQHVTPGQWRWQKENPR